MPQLEVTISDFHLSAPLAMTPVGPYDKAGGLCVRGFESKPRSSQSLGIYAGPLHLVKSLAILERVGACFKSCVFVLPHPTAPGKPENREVMSAAELRSWLRESLAGTLRPEETRRDRR